MMHFGFKSSFEFVSSTIDDDDSTTLIVSDASDDLMNVNVPFISGDDASSTTIFVVRNLCTECDSSGPKFIYLHHYKVCGCVFVLNTLFFH